MSGMVDNVGIAVGIATPSLALKSYIHFRFCWPTSLISVMYNAIVDQRRLTSGNVLSVTSKSGVVENVGAAFGIASQLAIVQKLFSVPVSRPS